MISVDGLRSTSYELCEHSTKVNEEKAKKCALCYNINPILKGSLQKEQFAFISK